MDKSSSLNSLLEQLYDEEQLEQLYEEEQKEQSTFILHNPYYGNFEPRDYTPLTKESKVQDGFYVAQKNKHKKKRKK